MNLYIDLAYSALKCKTLHSEFSFPNEIRIAADPTSLQMDGVPVYDFEGNKLVIGETVTGQTLHQRDFGFLMLYAPVLVAHAIRLSNVHYGSITGLKIVIPFENCKNGDRVRLIERLSCFVVDGREYRYEVECLPQGVGVFLEYLHEAKPQDKTESGYVLDFGYNTVLLVKYEDLKPRHADSEQLDQYGFSRVVARLGKELHKRFKLHMPLIEVNGIFRNRNLDDCGERHDISDLCDKAVSEYLTQIFLELLDKNAEKFRRVNKIIIGGGGAYYITPAAIPEMLRKMVHIMPNQPEFANVRGFMRVEEEAASKAALQAA